MTLFNLLLILAAGAAAVLLWLQWKNKPAPEEEGEDVTISDEEPAEEEAKEDDSLMIRVFEWQAEGYETGELEQLVREGDPDVEKKFKKFEKNIGKLKNIIDELESMEAD